jgi:hypothetical protein
MDRILIIGILLSIIFTSCDYKVPCETQSGKIINIPVPKPKRLHSLTATNLSIGPSEFSISQLPDNKVKIGNIELKREWSSALTETIASLDIMQYTFNTFMTTRAVACSLDLATMENIFNKQQNAQTHIMALRLILSSPLSGKNLKDAIDKWIEASDKYKKDLKELETDIKKKTGQDIK